MFYQLLSLYLRVLYRFRTIQHFADYNDINEDTRAQIEAINTTLAELQAKPKNTPRRPVGFTKPKE